MLGRPRSARTDGSRIAMVRVTGPMPPSASAKPFPGMKRRLPTGGVSQDIGVNDEEGAERGLPVRNFVEGRNIACPISDTSRPVAAGRKKPRPVTAQTTVWTPRCCPGSGDRRCCGGRVWHTGLLRSPYGPTGTCHRSPERDPVDWPVLDCRCRPDALGKPGREATVARSLVG